MGSALDYFRRCVALSEAQIRIAAPNRCMIGHCLWYENQLPAAIAEVQSANDDAQRFGVVPVQVFAQVSMAQLLTEAGLYAEAGAACMRGIALARLAGSRRYEATHLYLCAEHSLLRGDRAQAREHLEQAYALARQTGLGFIGAPLLARLSRTAITSDERATYLADGETLLKNTGLAHNHLWFYREAIEASLAAGEWATALAYAGALEQVCQVEPLPWVGLVVERARAIVAAVASNHGEAPTARLQQVRATAIAAGNGWALAGIDQALAHTMASSLDAPA
jgi:tetratricopeptide (TPR) repeat protein